jgi:stearoyl-CoA desaturase (delta-9 desaturase)
MGWLLVRKHPEVLKRGKTLDLSDLYGQKMLVFQRRYYPYLVVLLCFVMPTVVPMYLWGEGFMAAFTTAALLRYCYGLHVTWCVNSIAHLYGPKPYDKNINPSQNLWTSVTAMGEGFHNYHHTFPQDYKASELPYLFNPSTLMIDFFGLIGWAYDRKTVSEERIKKQKMLYGEQK